jgi:hypothetical protein
MEDEPRFDFTDFDRYVVEHRTPEENWPEAFALWLAEITGGPVPRFEKVERKERADGVVANWLAELKAPRAPEGRFPGSDRVRR